MLGTIWINIGLAILASVVTFGVAWVSNVWLVSLERAGVAFLLFFLAAFPIRWLLGMLAQPSDSVSATNDAGGVGSAESPDNLPHPTSEQVVESDEQDAFIPLAFAQPERNPLTEDPTTVAEVIRRLSDE